jgi:hypothetical protein
VAVASLYSCGDPTRSAVPEPVTLSIAGRVHRNERLTSNTFIENGPTPISRPIGPRLRAVSDKVLVFRRTFNIGVRIFGARLLRDRWALRLLGGDGDTVFLGIPIHETGYLRVRQVNGLGACGDSFHHTLQS